jgi:ring-1,2-phenylacetyl-CoA epoxidase subunit PaaB
LLNARDVFVRRPSCYNLWVAPESAVFKMTAYELETIPDWWEEELPPDAAEETYYIFNKQTQRRSMVAVTHVGEVQARSPREALKKAIDSGEFVQKVAYAWWVVPESAITSSREEDVLSMFEPAREKTYRDQSYYTGGVFARRSQRRPEDIRLS